MSFQSAYLVTVASSVITALAAIGGSIVAGAISYFGTVRQMKNQTERQYAEAHLQRKLDIITELEESFYECRSVVENEGKPERLFDHSEWSISKRIDRMEQSRRQFVRSARRAEIYLTSRQSLLLKQATLLFTLKINKFVVDEADEREIKSIRSDTAESRFNFEDNPSVELEHDGISTELEYSEDKYKQGMEAVETIIREEMVQPTKYFD